MHDYLSDLDRYHWSWSKSSRIIDVVRQEQANLSKSITMILSLISIRKIKRMKKRLTCWCRRYKDTAIWNGKLQNWWKLGAKLTTLSVSVLIKLTTWKNVTKNTSYLASVAAVALLFTYQTNKSFAIKNNIVSYS